MKTIIRVGVVLLALAPAVLLAVVLMGYLNKARMQDLERALVERGQALVNQLATASRYGLNDGDGELLTALARTALREPDVSSVLIQDAEGRILVNLNNPAAASSLPIGRPSVWLEAPVYSADPAPGFTFNEALVPPEALGRVSMELSRETLALGHRNVIKTSILLIAGCLLLAAGFGWRMGRKLIEPVMRLEASVRKLGNGLAKRAAWRSSSPEVGSLVRDINAVGLVLRASHRHIEKRIEDATADLRQAMEKLRAENAALDLARQTAVDASRAKSEFLASMSHEIRTPMNGVLGFLELLSRTELNTAQQGYLRILRAASGNLMAILNDILDLSKIEAGKFKIRKRPFDLREVLENAVLLFAANARHKGLRLWLDIAPDTPTRLVGDGQRIAQIVANFVSNAIKFTLQGEVEVRVGKALESPRMATLHVEIRDTGMGVKPEDRERLFQAFEQYDASDGAGLGLAISRRLVAMMDGDIRLESQPGVGSVFYISLVVDKAPEQVKPVKRRPATVLLLTEDATAARVVGHILEFDGFRCLRVEDSAAAVEAFEKPMEAAPVGIIIDADSARPGSEALLATLQEREAVLILLGADETHPEALRCAGRIPGLRCAGKPPVSGELLPLLGRESASPAMRLDDGAGRRTMPVRVLLADDNTINRQLARIFLGHLGAQVDEADDGGQVLEACRGQRYDLILMDLRMPVLDGLETTRSLRALNGNPNRYAPVVALTADAMNRQRSQYLDAGMNDWLAKPITEAALQRVLEKWCPGYSMKAEDGPATGRYEG